MSEHDGIDPDVARARTLPASWYTDPQILDRARERAFARARPAPALRLPRPLLG